MKTCRGLGMPVSKQPGTFGDLKIKFNILFPTKLSDDQKKALKSIL
jgi:DnaJ homolog subfamily B member 4